MLLAWDVSQTHLLIPCDSSSPNSCFSGILHILVLFKSLMGLSCWRSLYFMKVVYMRKQISPWQHNRHAKISCTAYNKCGVTNQLNERYYRRLCLCASACGCLIYITLTIRSVNRHTFAYSINRHLFESWLIHVTWKTRWAKEKVIWNWNIFHG